VRSATNRVHILTTNDRRTFWPVTIRPPDQLELEVAEAAPYPTLQERLAKVYQGRTLTFLDLLNEDYPHGVWLEQEYRAAIKAMGAADPPRVEIRRQRLTNRGKPATRGLKYEDLVSFCVAATSECAQRGNREC
jgi:hypothetical protein